MVPLVVEKNSLPRSEVPVTFGDIFEILLNFRNNLPLAQRTKSPTAICGRISINICRLSDAPLPTRKYQRERPALANYPTPRGSAPKAGSLILAFAVASDEFWGMIAYRPLALKSADR
jgi:hypothetical protein